MTTTQSGGTPRKRRSTPAAAPDPTAVEPEPVATHAVEDPAKDQAPGPGDDRRETDPDTLDFVTFVVQGESYAFPMDSVEEIIRMPQVVRVPLGPESLEGLANLRGRILPVVSLRACCGLPPVEQDEATRVIVVDGGATLGFVVDRVSSVTSVDAARVDTTEQIGGTIDSDLLAGVIRPGRDDEELTKVLDVHRLVEGQFALLSERSSSTTSLGLGATGTAADGDDADDDTLELVSFAVDGQEYALPIDRVQEIVQAPERVTTVPNSGDRLLGVMDLRGRLLPVVGLRQVFGLAPAPLEPQNRIVVVHVPSGPGQAATSVVGVVMDTVREVLRVPNALVAELPEFMSRGNRAREVASVCRLEDGSRLVSVLSVERMFGAESFRAAVEDAVGSVLGADTTDDATDPADGFDVEEGLTVAVERDGDAEDDELLVAFRLGEEEFAVDVDTVQEIIRVPETLIRVPKSLDFVEGLVNLRGAVLPVVDLRTRLGLARCARDERQRIIVLIVGGVRTGFIVDSVTEVLRVSGANLQPAPELSPEQARMIAQVAHLQGSGRMLMMLQPDHLLAAHQLASLIPHQRDAQSELSEVDVPVG